MHTTIRRQVYRMKSERRDWLRLLGCVLVASAFTACGGSVATQSGSPLAALWSSSSHPAPQSGAITFDVAGQIVLIQASDNSGGRSPGTPFAATVAGSCASVDPSISQDGSFIVTAINGGQCSLSISDGTTNTQIVTLPVTVPSVAPTPGRAPLSVTWTAAFSQQHQNSITFPAVGQTANLHAMETLAGQPSGTPFSAAVLGRCAQVTPSSNNDGNFVLSALSTGRCIVAVSDSMSPVQHVDFSVSVP